MSEFPNKKYDVIYADPPWTYGDKLQHHGGSADSHYATMTTPQICELPIEKIASDNCSLFIWGTWPQLPDILQVIAYWGFQYKTIGFLWLKEYSTGRKVFGMGNWTRGNSEFCLLAVRGKPKRLSNMVSQLITTRIREHSKKPDIVRKKIVQLCGDIPRIELFARTKIHGWDTWGNDPNLGNQTLEDF